MLDLMHEFFKEGLGIGISVVIVYRFMVIVCAYGQVIRNFSEVPVIFSFLNWFC